MSKDGGAAVPGLGLQARDVQGGGSGWCVVTCGLVGGAARGEQRLGCVLWGTVVKKEIVPSTSSQLLHCTCHAWSGVRIRRYVQLWAVRV